MENKNLNKDISLEVEENAEELDIDLEELTKEKLESLTKRLDHMVPDERY